MPAGIEDHMSRELTHVLEAPGVAAGVGGQGASFGRQLGQLRQLWIPADTGHATSSTETRKSAGSHLIAVEVDFVEDKETQRIGEGNQPSLREAFRAQGLKGCSIRWHRVSFLGRNYNISRANNTHPIQLSFGLWIINKCSNLLPLKIYKKICHIIENQA